MSNQLENISTFGWFGSTSPLLPVATYGWFFTDDLLEGGLFIPRPLLFGDMFN
jgi:hypothetical protein